MQFTFTMCFNLSNLVIFYPQALAVFSVTSCDGQATNESDSNSTVAIAKTTTTPPAIETNRKKSDISSKILHLNQIIKTL